MSVIKAIYDDLKEKFSALYPETADYDARYILKERADIEWADLIVRPEQILAQDVVQIIYDDARRYLDGEPLSRIYGRRAFWGLTFKVTKDTLDPRPDTETLVRAVLNRYKDGQTPQRILDLGTGTGCIVIALLREWPDAYGVAVDKSEAALQVAKENAKMHGVDDRLSFVCTDWLSAFGIAENDPAYRGFDVIVSNPPYISGAEIESLSPAVRNFDPILALEAQKNGLAAYETIFAQIKNVLHPLGRAFFEIGIGQSDDIARLAGNALSRVVDIYPDNAGIPRVVEIFNGDK